MSSLTVDDIINFALINKSKYVVLTDFNVMYGAIEFYNKAIANNLKPIIGLHIKYDNRDLYLIAKNNHGYKQLMKISSFINTNQQYELNDYLDDLFIVASDANNLNLRIKQEMLFSLNQDQLNPIASFQSYCQSIDEVKYLKMLKAIKHDQLFKNINDEFKNSWMLTEPQAQKIFNQKAIDNLNQLLEQCSWTIEFNKERHFIEYNKFTQNLQTKSSQHIIQSLCKSGLEKIFGVGNVPEEYIKRLKHELDIINDMGFNDYFLVVSDYVSFAKNNGILVGPGRGSAAGSLVSYVLGITGIDPIEHHLIFERFLNPERSTMPDIDVDFLDERRNEVIEYVFNKYGVNHVAHIITFQRMKAKLAIRDVGRALGIELVHINKLTSAIGDDTLETFSKKNELNRDSSEIKKLFDFAIKFQDFPRQNGLHAAGIVLSNVDLNEVVPVIDSTDGIYCTQYSMEYLEPLGLIKMDVLGLSNLSTLNQIIKLIKQNYGKTIELNKIPLDDQKVFNFISNGNTTGIFQLESPGMTDLIKRIKPISIEDISICSSLFRPGPQKNIPLYLKNKINPENIVYLNDDVKKILSATYNVIIYQEQVIQIVRKIAGFTLAEADLFRRAISKKNVERFQEIKTTFINGGVKQGYSEELVNKIFDTIFEFANYGFNHSHSLAYSYISYWLSYFAYYYPLEFYGVLLINNKAGNTNVSTYISKAKERGVKILPPDLNQSNESFTIKKSGIIFGFDAVKGIGYEKAKDLIKLRNNQPNKKFENYDNAIKLITKNGTISLTLMKNLIYAGALDSLLNDKSRYWLTLNWENIASSNITTDSLIHEIIKEPTTTEIENLTNKQQELIGAIFNEDPIIKIKEKFNHNDLNLLTISQLTEPNNYSAHIHALVEIIKIREITDKRGEKMAFLKLRDETQVVDVVCFSSAYKSIRELIKQNEYFIVTLIRKINSCNFHLAKARKVDYESTK